MALRRHRIPTGAGVPAPKTRLALAFTPRARPANGTGTRVHRLCWSQAARLLRERWRGTLAVVILASTVVTALVVPAHVGDGAGGSRCRAVVLPVSLAPGRGRGDYLAMRYCEPRWWAQPHAADVLTDGETYTRYWDWPAPSGYSVVDRILSRGRATVTYDRIGTGMSSRPPSTAVSLDVDVWMLEQVLRWLNRQHYQRFTSWTHSYSAAVGIKQAATPGMTTVQRLVVTGFLHSPEDPSVAAQFHPANQDDLRWRDRDDGWLTTKPGTRGQLLHGPAATVDVVRIDEERKDVISATALRGYADVRAAPAATNPSRRVTAAVVLAIGLQNAALCRVVGCFDSNTIMTSEAAYYPAAASLSVVTAQAGHSMMLEPSAGTAFEAIEDALAQYVSTHRRAYR